MTENRSEIVSLRFSPSELAQLKEASDGRGLSSVLREKALAGLRPPNLFGNPQLVEHRGLEWTLWCAPSRLIQVGQGGDNWWPHDIRLKSPGDARALAAALLQAADVAERPESDEEAP